MDDPSQTPKAKKKHESPIPHKRTSYTTGRHIHFPEMSLSETHAQGQSSTAEASGDMDRMYYSVDELKK